MLGWILNSLVHARRFAPNRDSSKWGCRVKGIAEGGRTERGTNGSKARERHRPTAAMLLNARHKIVSIFEYISHDLLDRRTCSQ